MGLIIPNDDLKRLYLLEIEKILLMNGKSLKDFKDMPFPAQVDVDQFGNYLIFDELNYDVDDMRTKHDEFVLLLNGNQRKVNEQ
ncbi:hypothetical protein SESBI_38256, partial [Sesbania bispinosa]